jgi:uncharacterized protein
MKNIYERLTGRVAYIAMHPFTVRELKRMTDEVPFNKNIFKIRNINKLKETSKVHELDIIKGGMPSICNSIVENPFIWFKRYELTYLDRDIRNLSRIGNIIPFRGLLHLVALRSGGIINISDLARDARITSATISNYLSIMGMSFVFYRLTPFLNNKTNRLVKSSKYYISDSGLASHLCNVEDITDTPYKGVLFETYVAQNLKGIIDSAWLQASLLFWNIQGRHEVDFIIEAGASFMAIEVKSSERWGKPDLAGLKAFISATPKCVAGNLAYNGLIQVSLGEKLWAIPSSTLLQ